MSDAHNIDFVATTIGDCGTADELAILAKQLIVLFERLADPAFKQCYDIIKTQVISYAGITDEFVAYVDTAIYKFF
jgi:hypothetical protein